MVYAQKRIVCLFYRHIVGSVIYYKYVVQKIVIEEYMSMQQNFQAFNHATTAESSAEKASLQERLLDGVITASLTTVFFGVPVFFTAVTMQGIVFDKYIFFYIVILLALVAWAAKGALGGRLILRRTPLDYVVLAFIAVVVLSTIVASGDRWHSVWGQFGDPSHGVVALLAFVAIFFLVVTHSTPRRSLLFFTALMMAAGVVAIWTLLALTGVPFLPERIARMAPLSMMGSLQSLALFLAASVPLWMTSLFALWNSETISRSVRGVATAGALVALIATLVDIHMLLQYVPLIPFAIGVTFFLVFVLARLVRAQGALPFIPMIVLVIVVGFLMASPSRSPLLSDHVVLPPTVSMTPSLAWEITRSALSEHFFLGFGPAQFEHAFSTVRPEGLNTHQLFALRFTQGEGIIFDALATIGVLGTVALLLVGATFLSILLYLLARDAQRNKVFTLGLTSAIIIVIGTLLTRRIDGSALIICVLLGVLALVSAYRESGLELRSITLSLKASPQFALSLAFVSIILIAGVGMSFFSVGKIFAADVFAGSAVRASEVTKDTLASLQRAITLNPREGAYWMRLAQEFAVLANREALKPEKERDLNALRAYLQQAQLAANTARIKLPTSAAAAEVYAQIMENTSIYDPTVIADAQTAYEEAQKREPSNPVYVLKRAELALRAAIQIDAKDEAARKDALAAARDLFTEAIEKKENFASAYYQRALIQQALGDMDAAVEDMTKAFVSTNNTNITYAYNLAVLLRERDAEGDAARAEALLRSILGVNDAEVNTLLALATLYERKDQQAAAIATYERLLEVLPDGEKANEQTRAARKQISEKINTLKRAAVTPEGNPSQTVAPSAENSGENTQTNTDAPTNGGDAAAPANTETPTESSEAPANP